MGIRLNFNLGICRVSVGAGGIRFYGNSAQKKPSKSLNPRISVSKGGKGFSAPLAPKKGRGIRWWL